MIEGILYLIAFFFIGIPILTILFYILFFILVVLTAFLADIIGL